MDYLYQGQEFMVQVYEYLQTDQGHSDIKKFVAGTITWLVIQHVVYPLITWCLSCLWSGVSKLTQGDGLLSEMKKQIFSRYACWDYKDGEFTSGRFIIKTDSFNKGAGYNNLPVDIKSITSLNREILPDLTEKEKNRILFWIRDAAARCMERDRINRRNVTIQMVNDSRA